MAIPLIWYERRSPHSRFSRVHLEMLTTPGSLTVAAHAALIAISAPLVEARYGTISPHGAVWDRVPAGAAADFARAVFRAVRRPRGGHVQSSPAEIPAPGTMIRLVPRLAQSA